MEERSLRRFVPAASCWLVIALVMAIAGPSAVAALRSASDGVAAIAPGTPGLKARPPSSQAPPGAPGAPAVSFDMVVTDREGRVPDSLGPADLTVSVDGKARRVLSLRRVSRGPGALSDAAARQARGGGVVSFAAEPGRNILVVVDQGTLVRGDERPAITAGNAFLDRLGMADRVAVLRLPLSTGQLVSLTTEQPVAREALTHVLGQVMPAALLRPGDLPTNRDMDLAVAVGSDRAGSVDPVAAVPAPTVDQEFDPAAQHGAFAGLAGMLRALEAVPGRKVVALISAGVVAPSSPQVTDLAAAAVAARTVIHAFGVAQPRGDVRGEPELGPIETLAKATGGAFVMLGRNPERVIGRVAAEIAVCYVVELEGSAGDADGRRHVLRVDLANRSLSVRAPAWLVPAPDAGDVAPAGPAPVPAAGVPAGSAADGAASPRAPAATSAKDAELQLAMGRLVDYAEAYERQYSGLVAEEDYRQSASRKSVRLRSDYLLVKPEGSDRWVSFRDVYEVDGAAVRDRDDRLRRLFLQPGVQIQTQLMAIHEESARHNIGAVERNINVPLFPLRFLTPENRPRFRFKTAGRRESAGVDVWRVEFEELVRPTIISDLEDRDVPAKGWFLVDQATGAIVESCLRIAEHGSTGEIIVSFRRDPALGMWVPAKMTETYQAQGSRIGRTEPFLWGTATYSKFRRFQVKTEETITIPK
jgi:VWFA-related protein